MHEAAVTDRVCVAQIGAAHGIRGEVRLWAFTEDPAAIAGYGALETEDGARRFTIETLRRAKDHLVVRLSGIADRDAAEALRNTKLFVPRARLPATDDDDTFYHADLIGLAAVTPDGGAFGDVVAMHNFGAGDLLEIKLAGSHATVLLPFTKAVVPAVELANRRIVIDPPADAVDPPETEGPGTSDGAS
jgi:16S rRNA processing protein RimM